MRFSRDEIRQAERLKELGLHWTPSVGHYVWDQVNLIDCPSPFHDKVYYILDLKHFLRRGHSIENLKKSLCWLPTWHDARAVLDQFNVTGQAIAERLQVDDALANHRERLALYELIEEALAMSASPPTMAK